MLELGITHHSLDKVQVLGHHVVEVVGDEDSPHEKLRFIKERAEISYRNDIISSHRFGIRVRDVP